MSDGRLVGIAFASDEARCELDYECSDCRAEVGVLAVAGNALESVSVVECGVSVEACGRTFAYNEVRSVASELVGVMGARSLFESMSEEARYSVLCAIAVVGSAALGRLCATMSEYRASKAVDVRAYDRVCRGSCCCCSLSCDCDGCSSFACMDSYVCLCTHDVALSDSML